LRGDEVFVNRSIGNQLLVVSPLSNPLGIEIYSCAYSVPAVSVSGERGGRLPAFVSFNPIGRYSFAAWKSPENHNGSTDFSNIYDWLELINWKWRRYPVSQPQVSQWLGICQTLNPLVIPVHGLNRPQNFRSNHVNPKTTNSKEKKGEKDYGRSELINHVVSHFYTLIVLNTLNATPVPIKQPGICGWKCNSLTFSM
jgi:hypothetical protein